VLNLLWFLANPPAKHALSLDHAVGCFQNTRKRESVMTVMASDSYLSKEVVLQRLEQVYDASLGRNIVALGYVQHVRVCGGVVAFDLVLPTPSHPDRQTLVEQARQAVAALPGVTDVNVALRCEVARTIAPRSALSSVKNVIAVASGKGGVGKSTVAVNLALALAQSGADTGLMDADVYGPSIPTLMGVAEQPGVAPSGKMMPLQRYGVRLMSIGFLAGSGAPVIWRGPLASKLIQQFLGEVEWGELDYLVIDLPPGTGDVQLTLCQAASLSGAVVVTTPQQLALEDVTRAINMFGKVNVPIIGIVENMSYFICKHCGAREDIFLHGGGRRVAGELGVPFLGEVPLDPEICSGGDNGIPIVVEKPDSPQSTAFREIAQQTALILSRLAMETPPAEQELLRVIS